MCRADGDAATLRLIVAVNRAMPEKDNLLDHYFFGKILKVEIMDRMCVS